MSVALTAAGESLIARLFHEGKPLVIDRFYFAFFDGQDHTQPVDPAQGLPGAERVHCADIPPEYRAFINPNQVVYSALLGSDLGDFSFNWQGLYCAEHETLVAVATFPPLNSRAYNEAANTPGNNLTRNFILEFSGAQRLTGISIEAKVWQLDFTVRLKGIDERERLSNRDIYGRAAFLEDGWKLSKEEEKFFLLPGAGYVEGIRVALREKLQVFPKVFPCDVWLDVCMEPEGSDIVAKARISFLPDGGELSDYVTAPPAVIAHYCVKVAHITAGREPENTRPGWKLLLPYSWIAQLTGQMYRLSDRVTKAELELLEPCAADESGSVEIVAGETQSWKGIQPYPGITVAPLTLAQGDAAPPAGAAIVARLSEYSPEAVSGNEPEY